MVKRNLRVRLPGHRGGSLAETIVCLAIVGLLMVPAMDLLGSVARSSAIDAHAEQLTSLSCDLLAEVLQASFADPEEPTRAPGVDTGEDASSRATFDDLDDYAGWTENPPRDRDGNALPGLNGYRRTVSVTFASAANPNANSSSATDLKRVTVVSADAFGTQAAVSCLRYRYGPWSVEPGREAAFVRSATVQVRLGADGSVLRSGTAVLNQLSLEDADVGQ
jgi:hypothetical protein